jgi:hypothetical protein
MNLIFVLTLLIVEFSASGSRRGMVSMFSAIAPEKIARTLQCTGAGIGRCGFLQLYNTDVYNVVVDQNSVVMVKSALWRARFIRLSSNIGQRAERAVVAP